MLISVQAESEMDCIDPDDSDDLAILITYSAAIIAIDLVANIAQLVVYFYLTPIG